MDNEYILRVSWDEVGDYLNSVAQRINPHDFTGVYGIPRGGSVLGAWLSHKLYLPLLSEVQPNCIIIDDICDSGKTVGQILNSIKLHGDKNCYTTVMFHRPQSCAPVDYYYKEKYDSWIAFPWEQ